MKRIYSWCQKVLLIYIYIYASALLSIVIGNFGMFVIGITGNYKVRVQSYYGDGYQHMFILWQNDSKDLVARMETDLIASFRGCRNMQNVRPGGDSAHQMLKSGPPFYVSEWKDFRPGYSVLAPVPGLHIITQREAGALCSYSAKWIQDCRMWYIYIYSVRP